MNAVSPTISKGWCGGRVKVGSGVRDWIHLVVQADGTQKTVKTTL
jgi:hypothetical protein